MTTFHEKLILPYRFVLQRSLWYVFKTCSLAMCSEINQSKDSILICCNFEQAHKLDEPADDQKMVSKKNLNLVGRSQIALTRRGSYVILEMSTICRSVKIPSQMPMVGWQ